MRLERLYLLDIVQAAEAIHRFCEGISEDQFLQDELRQSAVLQKLSVVGEAATRLPEEFQNRHQYIEWADIIGFRNIAVHEYFAVTWSIVWTTAIRDVPALQSQIVKILTDEYGED